MKQQGGVVFYVASPFWGGGEQYVWQLAQALKSHGWQVSFVVQCGSDSVLCERLSALGEVLTLKVSSRNGKFSLVAAWRLMLFARKHNSRIIHVNALKDYFVAVWARILSFGSLRIVANNHLVERAKHKPSWRWAYRHIDCLVNVSECAKSEFLSSGVEPYFRNIRVILNSVPDMQTPPPVQHEGVRVLYHGRVCREKGIAQLAEHWGKTAPDVHLYIVGAGDEVRGERVHYMGFRCDVRDIIPEFDICVSPSVVPESGGPLSLIEAMAAARPVVASSNGSQPEYMTDGEDGILCEAGNWGEFVSAINYLAANPDRCIQMGANARLHYTCNNDFSHFVSQIESIYEAIL